MNLLWIYPPAPKPGTPWEWPMAVYQGAFSRHAAYVLCNGSYFELAAKISLHSQLGLIILKYNEHSKDNPKRNGRRMLSGRRFRSLRSAIEFTDHFLSNNPDWHPRIF